MIFSRARERDATMTMTEDTVVGALPKYRVFDSNNTDNRTRCGNHRYKNAIRAGFRAVALLLLLAVFCAYHYAVGSLRLPGRRFSATDGDVHTQERSLQGIFQDTADPLWYLLWYILGILYLFLAIAIVCDEFFIPALEVMVDEDHLNMSRDIAGATLMAAGGSAPELFTSIFGTFEESEVGFGTIVGSAVFNVLFVIGMCSVFSTEVLTLSWWPLIRDCSYYVLGLVVLGVFVGVVSEGIIEWWEALILFAMYFGYVILMAFNVKLYKAITGKDLYTEDENSEGGSPKQEISFQYPHTFRAGLLTFIKDKENWQATARLGFLYGIAGNFDDVFSRIDQNGDGTIDKQEMANCFKELGTTTTDNELDAIMADIDDDGDNKVSRAEFKKWYLGSEEFMKTRVREVFNKFDTDNSGTICKPEFMAMLQKVDPSAGGQYKDESATALFDEKDRTALSFEEFTEWYFKSLLFAQQKKNIQSEEEEDGGLCAVICPPKGGSIFDYFKWAILFPIVASLSLTIPNATRPHLAKWCYASFVLSILWIGIYSYFMVGFATVIGDTVGIPDFIMGLTFLAAGTSVPDLLSSVIVARMGEGDMAVSSSIGSNIFDILVGLPFPWLLFTLIKGRNVSILTDGIWINIMILVAMIVLIIGAIHLQGWKLTKMLAYIMFFLYFAFLAQAILRNYL